MLGVLQDGQSNSVVRLRLARDILRAEHSELTAQRNDLAGTGADLSVVNAKRDRLWRIMDELDLLRFVEAD